MTLKPKVIKVNVFGQDYVVRSPAGQKYIEKVAKYVTKNMEEIRKSGIDDSQQLRISVLAAMNITDEYLSTVQIKNEAIDKFESKTIMITEYIDKKISELEFD